jgi:hypothetical protein
MLPLIKLKNLIDLLRKGLLGMLLKNPIEITEIITYVKNANSIISD